MKLGKHAVKVIVIFLALFLVGIGLKFVGLHEGFVVKDFNVVVRKYSNKNSYMANAEKAWDIAADPRTNEGTKKRRNERRNKGTNNTQLISINNTPINVKRQIGSLYKRATRNRDKRAKKELKSMATIYQAAADLSKRLK
jgi:hypothetical protein